MIKIVTCVMELQQKGINIWDKNRFRSSMRWKMELGFGTMRGLERSALLSFVIGSSLSRLLASGAHLYPCSYRRAREEENDSISRK